MELGLDLWINKVAPLLEMKELVCLSRVNTFFYSVARSNRAWQRHRDYLCLLCPPLTAVFDHYERQKPKKKRFKKGVELQKRASKGIWYVICKILMRPLLS